MDHKYEGFNIELQGTFLNEKHQRQGLLIA